MRLHTLRLRAFGPFADEVAVDFDDLAGDGLFLLHGQTGAGKTTILDAVAFALFGRVPGPRNTDKRLHSDHAPAERVPEVELEATIGGRRLRIIRSPEHRRPKKRGTGTTAVHARATLEWIDGSGPPLTRLPEIGEAVIRLLGMSADQFFQVVLLPQGEFARFLRAANEDREALLERLFDTQRFGDVEEWLRDRARQSATVLDERTGSAGRIAAQIAALVGTAQPADADMAWAQECLDEAGNAARVARAALTAARRVRDDAQHTHDRAGALMEHRGRGSRARARLAELDAGAAEVIAARDALAAARRAAPVVPVADELARSEKAVAAAASARAAAETAFAELDEAAETVGADDATLAAAIERWTAESGRWEPLAARVAQRPGLVADLAALDARIGADDERIAELDTALAEVPHRREAAVEAVRAATQTRTQLASLRADLERIDTIGTALTERAALTAGLEASASRARSATEEHLAAREHLVALRERRVAGMAAELAGRLVDGEPCVVCGASDHPAPAAAGDTPPVSEADETAAVDREHAASATRTRAEADLARLTERRTHLDDVIGAADDEWITGERSRLGAAVAAAEQAAADLPGLERAVADLDEQAQAWQRERSERVAERSGRHERRTALRATIDALDADVAEATGGRVGVDERRAELDDLCRRAGRLRDAARELCRAERLRDEVAARLEAACRAEGFADAQAARSAAAPADQRTAWESMLSEADAIRAAAEATLNDPDVRDAMAADAVDLDATAAALATARDQYDAASGADAVAARRLTDLQAHVAEFWAAADGIAPLRDRHDELAALAELVAGRGQNARRMTLRSYVLAARLEEVLIAASVRLRQMSAGRYEFAHSDAVGPRGRRGGLGIEVRDEYTGVVRAATTLSGGETFFASLALALGLADVVAAEAGGRVLDTIFIDEGFGTLDPEALEEVMGVLDELRTGGRVVGVVSHVDELRARIPAQLQVLRGESGSHVRARTPLGAA